MMYLSHTLPGDPVLERLSEDQVTWYLMAYKQMQDDEQTYLDKIYDDDIPSNASSTSSTTSKTSKIYGVDDKGSRVVKGSQSNYGDDDTSWKDRDGDFELIPKGMSKEKIEAQLEELSRHTQEDYMESISGGTFHENYSKYNQNKILDANNTEAHKKLKEMQEKAKYLESIGKSKLPKPPKD